MCGVECVPCVPWGVRVAYLLARAPPPRSHPRVWDIHTGDMLNTLVHHCEAVLHLRFNSVTMVTCSKVMYAGGREGGLVDMLATPPPPPRIGPLRCGT